jgi:hypothetical protein
VSAVARGAVGALLRSFPAATAEGTPARGARKPLLARGPVVFRSAELDPSKPHRICILPFENSSGEPDAARVVADVLAMRLAAANGFEVVEPAVLREAALKIGIASFRWVETETLQKLAPAVGTPLFLRGSIGNYRDPSSNRAVVVPEIDLELTLVDVQNGHVLWSAQHERKGTDYAGLLMLGAVSNSVALADRVVTEMVDVASRPLARSEITKSAERKRAPDRHAKLRKPQER